MNKKKLKSNSVIDIKIFIIGFLYSINFLKNYFLKESY